MIGISWSYDAYHYIFGIKFFRRKFQKKFQKKISKKNFGKVLNFAKVGTLKDLHFHKLGWQIQSTVG